MFNVPPPTPEMLHGIPLLRCKPGGKINARIIGEPVRIWMHYTHNRSWPCTIFNCCLCKKHLPRRCYAFYPVTGASGQTAIIELTALAEAQLLEQMHQITDDFKGEMQLVRSGPSKRSTVQVTWLPDTAIPLNGYSSVSPELTISWLCKIWCLPVRSNFDDEVDWRREIDACIAARTSS